MRNNIGLFLIGIGSLLKTLFMILLIGSAAIGIWWPLTLAIIDKPVGALWYVPLGFFFTGLSFAIAGFIYDLVIGMPLALLTRWLLKEATWGSE
jgi:hypothetical protein